MIVVLNVLTFRIIYKGTSEVTVLLCRTIMNKFAYSITVKLRLCVEFQKCVLAREMRAKNVFCTPVFFS